jgi:hypothetical protein
VGILVKYDLNPPACGFASIPPSMDSIGGETAGEVENE